MQHSAVTPIDSLCASEISPPRYIDCYDRAVAILTRHPNLIGESWSVPYLEEVPEHWPLRTRREIRLTNFCHCLFGYVSSSRNSGPDIGCLTQIRISSKAEGGSGLIKAETNDLTFAIVTDERIPRSTGGTMQPDILPIFAGWQRRIDIKLSRKPLPMRVGG